MFPLNFMTNWLEDHLNSEQRQQESTSFSGETDATKQHQQTWPAITRGGVLLWEHHYRLCVVWNQSSFLGFDKRAWCQLGWGCVAGILTLSNDTFVFWSNETRKKVQKTQLIIEKLWSSCWYKHINGITQNRIRMEWSLRSSIKLNKIYLSSTNHNHRGSVSYIDDTCYHNTVSWVFLCRKSSFVNLCILSLTINLTCMSWDNGIKPELDERKTIQAQENMQTAYKEASASHQVSQCSCFVC